MSPKAQRLAIAEACGFTHIATNQKEHVDIESRSVTVWEQLEGLREGKVHRVPDYLNDLNAIVAAVKGLGSDQEIAYVSALHDVVFGYPNSYDDEPSVWHSDIFRLSHATAAQRAEAFLRTLGKWSENRC